MCWLLLLYVHETFSVSDSFKRIFCFPIQVGVAFWLIMQIAFGFGKKKALDWVLAMFISLIQSIIFIQPVKVTFQEIFINKFDNVDGA